MLVSLPSMPYSCEVLQLFSIWPHDAFSGDVSRLVTFTEILWLWLQCHIPACICMPSGNNGKIFHMLQEHKSKYFLQFIGNVTLGMLYVLVIWVSLNFQGMSAQLKLLVKGVSLAKNIIQAIASPLHSLNPVNVKTIFICKLPVPSKLNPDQPDLATDDASFSGNIRTTTPVVAHIWQPIFVFLSTFIHKPYDHNCLRFMIMHHYILYSLLPVMIMILPYQIWIINLRFLQNVFP